MRKILIIGGSRGIGNSLLNKLVDKNNVINISRVKPNLTHHNLTHHTCDILTDELPDLDELDSIIYSPGSINLKPINRLSINDFKNDFEINVIGAVKTVQKYLPILKNGTNPSIVFFSTVASDLGMPFHASVAASKSAVEGLTKSLGAELAPTVRVNAIAPTVTDTDLASKLLRNDRLKEMSAERHPLKKYLQPEEVAELAKFLISENASAMSGQIVEMDCGIVNLKV